MTHLIQGIADLQAPILENFLPNNANHTCLDNFRQNNL